MSGLVPIPEKSSFYTATALKGVLTRFGAPAEVLTDQGEEFQGEFAVLLQKLLIDHRTTSRDHPQYDGLAERMVQVVKEALPDLQQATLVSLPVLDSNGLSHEPSAFSRRVFTLFPPLWQVAHRWG
jgi:hypothetical protein